MICCLNLQQLARSLQFCTINLFYNIILSSQWTSISLELFNTWKNTVNVWHALKVGKRTINIHAILVHCTGIKNNYMYAIPCLQRRHNFSWFPIDRKTIVIQIISWRSKSHYLYKLVTCAPALYTPSILFWMNGIYFSMSDSTDTSENCDVSLE